MRVSDTARRMSWPTRAVIAAGVLALLLVAAVPVVLFVGVIMILLGHGIAGLALFGGSILAAGAAVVIAGFSGVRYLRRMITHSFRDFQIVELRRGGYDYHAR